MLVLSRKESQRIRLGDSIVITVVRLGGDKVRLGIQAPKDLLVLRDELVPFATAPDKGVIGSDAIDADAIDTDRVDASACTPLANSA